MKTYSAIIGVKTAGIVSGAGSSLIFFGYAFNVPLMRSWGGDIETAVPTVILLLALSLGVYLAGIALQRVFDKRSPL